MPPVFCASAITCRAMVVLPEDSGPKISTTRPGGKPPTPRAASKEIAPVGMMEMGTMASFDPSRMIEPFPNCFSIWESARSIALVRSSAMMAPENIGFMKTLVGYTHRLAGRKCRSSQRLWSIYHEANKKRIELCEEPFPATCVDELTRKPSLSASRWMARVSQHASDG